MGSFLEEIIKGGLGNVFGQQTQGGDDGDILGDILKGATKKTGGSTTTTQRTQVPEESDIARNIRKNAGASGPAPSHTPQNVEVDLEPESQQEGGMSDIVKELRRKMGLDVEEEPAQKTKTSKKAQKQQEEEQQGSPIGIDLGNLGGLGAILAILLGQGLNLGNLGDIAKSILKTIGLAGNSVK